jgi:MFS transporter, FHS family, glucose/mannose:H+ symporter
MFGENMSSMESESTKGSAAAQARLLINLGFVVAGVVTTVLGPLLPILISRWSMSDERAGTFLALQFFGNLAGIASLGLLISRRGYRLTLSLGFGVIALGILALALGNESMGLMATALYGYGLGLILAGTNLWVADVAGSRRAGALSILNAAWGIGAIASPVLVMFAHHHNQVFALLFAIAVCCGLLSALIASMDIEPRGAPESVKKEDAPAVKARVACVLGALFFLYIGAESAIGGWAAAFGQRLGTGTGKYWELTPLFFWSGLLTGRALAPIVLREVSEGTLLSGGLLCGGIFNGALLWVHGFAAAATALFFLGLGFAAVYPLLISSMVARYGRRASRAGSVLFALASFGGATMSWLVGFVSTHADSLRVGLLVPLAGCLLMIGILPLLRDRASSQQVEEESA